MARLSGLLLLLLLLAAAPQAAEAALETNSYDGNIYALYAGNGLPGAAPQQPGAGAG